MIFGFQLTLTEAIMNPPYELLPRDGASAFMANVKLELSSGLAGLRFLSPRHNVRHALPCTVLYLYGISADHH
jgi:hypothetical protein